MELLLWVLFGVVPAIAAMLLGVGVGGPRWLALALAVAVCVPFAIVEGWPGWPWQLDAMRGAPRPWAWWLFAFAGLLGWAYDLRLLPTALALVGEVALVGFLPWLLSARLRAGWSFELAVVYLSAGWCVLAALWWTLRRAGKAQPGLTVPLAMTAVLATDAWVLAQRTGGTHWQLAGCAATGLGFAVLTTTWRRHFVCGTGGTMFVTMTHVALLWAGRTERELVQAPLLLALIAPLPLWVVTARSFARRRAAGGVVAMVAVALCCAAAAAVA